MVTKPDIYCIMLSSASKREGEQVVSYAFQVDYVVENRTKALAVYSEYVRTANKLRADGFARGIVELFHPVIMPDGSYTTEIDGKIICEMRFGEQEGKE